MRLNILAPQTGPNVADYLREMDRARNRGKGKLAACRTEFNKMDMPCGYSRLGAGQAAGGFLEALCTLRLAHAAPVLS